MVKVIKEIMIMLLVCLVGMLLFAVIFYEFIPNKKDVPEISRYSPSEQVQSLKADDIDTRDDQVVLTYKVTSSDLTNYKVTKEYVPGKANPFAPVSEDPETNATTNSTGNTSSTNSTSNTTSGNTSTNSTSTNTSTGRLIEDEGTK